MDGEGRREPRVTVAGPKGKGLDLVGQQSLHFIPSKMGSR